MIKRLLEEGAGGQPVATVKKPAGRYKNPFIYGLISCFDLKAERLEALRGHWLLL